MKNIIFYPWVNRTLDEIWNYTENHHGKTQAKKYVNELFDYLEMIRKEPALWRSTPIESQSKILYFVKYRHHFIYFQQMVDDKIRVAALLHESMDIPHKLSKELAKLSRTH